MNQKYNTYPHKDINDMHAKFGTHAAVAAMNDETSRRHVQFRAECLKEEMQEIIEALEEQDAEEFVDGIIDWIVFGIGTLDLLGVDFETAWKRVHTANICKEVGIKTGRPNPLGLPDLKKPEGWCAPSHQDNHGILSSIWTAKK